MHEYRSSAAYSATTLIMAYTLIEVPFEFTAALVRAISRLTDRIESENLPAVCYFRELSRRLHATNLENPADERGCGDAN